MVMGRDALNFTCTRPKLNATVSASPDASTVNFAGPQISSSPPPANSTRALPESTTIVLPPPKAIARGVLPVTTFDGPSTETLSPATSPSIGDVVCPHALIVKIPHASDITAPNEQNLVSNGILIFAPASVPVRAVPRLVIAILYADERTSRIGPRRPRRIGHRVSQCSLRHAPAPALALAPHANSRYCMGCLFRHPHHRPNDALRSSRLASCAARVRSQRTSDWHILAPLDFFRHLVVAQSRHRRDEHHEL